MINDMHHFVVFKSDSVVVTELDNEGKNKQIEFTKYSFVNYVNTNNIQFYDWDLE